MTQKNHKIRIPADVGRHICFIGCTSGEAKSWLRKYWAIRMPSRIAIASQKKITRNYYA